MTNSMNFAGSRSWPPCLMIVLATFSLAFTWPREFDWRSNNGNWTTPVKNQGNCQSAWAFVAAALAESRIKIARGDTSLKPDLSEQHVISCNDNMPRYGCSGGNVFIALQFMSTKGIVHEKCFPYLASDAGCTGLCANWQDSVVKVTGYRALTAASKTALMDSVKTAVSSIGPVGASMMMYNSIYSYSSGVITAMTGSQLGGTYVLIVGYSEAGRYWICKNTWDTLWGEKGYFRISYDVPEFLTNNHCDVVTATDHDAITGIRVVPFGNSSSGNQAGLARNGRLSYSLSSNTRVTVSLYSLQGRKLAVLVHGSPGIGTHGIVVPGGAFRPGNYVLLFEVAGKVSSRVIAVME